MIARKAPGRQSLDSVRSWAGAAARAADSKGGEDTVVIGVGETLAITDAFVITSAGNARAVRTIAEVVEEAVKALQGPAPLRVEGLDDARWVLLDYGDFVVHVLSSEAREHYGLESLWGDGEMWEWRAPELAAVSTGPARL